VRPITSRGHTLRQERQDTEAPGEEEPEVQQMAVGDVADLVPEDRRDFDGRHRLDQRIGQQHVAKPGEDPRDARIEHAVPSVPDAHIRETKPGPLRHAFETATQGPVR
jgi:hypothetical protein